MAEVQDREGQCLDVMTTTAGSSSRPRSGSTSSSRRRRRRGAANTTRPFSGPFVVRKRLYPFALIAVN